MRCRYAMLAVFELLAVLIIAGCLHVDLPTTEEVEQIFVENIDVEVQESEVPPNVPILQASELGGWRMLCDECHIGPSYSSHTILNWGHLDVCLAAIDCFNCHGEDLHRMDVRGQKRFCYDCHLQNGIPVTCETCHTKEHIIMQKIHEPDFLGKHGSHAAEMEYQCYNCHGSENWCLSCHGLQMPHPEDIIDTHPNLVQGQPEVCANCHGSQSCLRCHTAYGVEIQLQ